MLSPLGSRVALLTSAALLHTPFVFGQTNSSSFNHTVQWFPCANQTQTPTSKGFSCGIFTIPLDYADPSAGSGQLSLIKINATEKRLGTLFFNPGGPGNSGVFFLANGVYNPIFLNVTQGHYDLVSWDPRGVGDVTIPGNIDCFNSSVDSNNFWNGTYHLVGDGPEFIGNFTDQSDIDKFYANLPVNDKAWSTIGDVCFKKHGNNLKYVGTAAAARDLVAMAETFDGPGAKVNYYGISYGTIIGNTLVNMFPDRFGKVIIDGVVDVQLWYNKPSYLSPPNEISDADSVLDEFVTLCAAAGPSACAFAEKNSTAQSVRAKLDTLIKDVYEDAKKNGTMTSAELRGTILDNLFTPATWQSNFKDLQTLYSSFQNSSNTNPSAPAPASSDPAPSYIAFTILCGDALPNQTNVTSKFIFDSILWNEHGNGNVSAIFGPRFSPPATCHKWPFRAIERYSGPFDKKLGEKILVIGNKGDPITPFHNARNVADALGDSAVLLKHNGYGHSSLTQPSSCTQGVIRAHLLEGKLPNDTTECEVDDVNLFPPTAQ